MCHVWSVRAFRLPVPYHPTAEGQPKSNGFRWEARSSSDSSESKTQPGTKKGAKLLNWYGEWRRVSTSLSHTGSHLSRIGGMWVSVRCAHAVVYARRGLRTPWSTFGIGPLAGYSAQQSRRHPPSSCAASRACAPRSSRGPLQCLTAARRRSRRRSSHAPHRG